MSGNYSQVTYVSSSCSLMGKGTTCQGCLDCLDACEPWERSLHYYHSGLISVLSCTNKGKTGMLTEPLPNIPFLAGPLNSMEVRAGVVVQTVAQAYLVCQVFPQDTPVRKYRLDNFQSLRHGHFWYQKVRRKADANKDQKLTKEELSNILAVFEEIEDLRKIFVENDKDDSGTMSFMEMIKKAGDFYGKHADKYGGGKAKAVMDKYAGDRGKEMTVNEFLDIMFAGLLN
uniref:EF-hand domain-containing protein n=1 Tax=Branchiostoma floridae TaxID=7739 RepID=C3Y3A5_BRAFL|eukprot:XP_002609162.1 hypothetical protein BRAFLDRAFT_126678 [Branchiostoma floridae]